MKDHYEVTIGIPVYKSVDYVRNTIISALNQTFLDIEFLIVDDCGGDGSIDVIEHLQLNHLRGNDIRILRNDHNRGVSFSRNRIVDEAFGKYLYFMDSDDEIEPDTIEILYTAVVQHHAQAAYGSYEIIDTVSATQNQVYQKDSIVFTSPDELAMYSFCHNNIFHVSVCNSLFDLAFLRQTGIRFLEVSFWEDMAFTTEMVTKINRAVLLSDITYHYLLRENSLSHYQMQKQIPQSDIMNVVGVLNYLKSKTIKLKGKPYLPYLCYNLEVNSFYVICYILRNSYRIVPKIKSKEIRQIMKHPLSIGDIWGLNDKRTANFVLGFLEYLPYPIFLIVVLLLGKIKRVI